MAFVVHLVMVNWFGGIIEQHEFYYLNVILARYYIGCRLECGKNILLNPSWLLGNGKSDVQCTTARADENYKVFLTWSGIFLYYAELKNNVCRKYVNFKRWCQIPILNVVLTLPRPPNNLYLWGRSELTDRNVELYPQFFLELITTQLRFYMVSPQLSLLNLYLSKT